MIEFPAVLDDLMMAQQPILKRSKEIFGHELLFREKDPQQAHVADGEAATSQVLVNLCLGIVEMESQLNQPFFVNMTSELILSDAFFPINPETMYIEILESQVLTPGFLIAVQKWSEAGYRFVLDGYQFDSKSKELLPWVTIVKINVLETPPEKHIEQITELQNKGLTLLAEKIEDEATFELCKSLDFDLYQGYFFKYPKIIKGKKVSSTTNDTIRLVNALQNKDIDIEELTSLISKSPKLSYQLLRILNSPLCGIARTVVSIKEAIVFLGLVQLKRWALLISFTSSQEQPIYLLKMLLTRAYCCQLLAEKKHSQNIGSAFMIGLMSGMDIVFNLDQKIVLEQIALDEETLDAIINKTGELGTYLAQTLHCEEQDWEAIAAMPSEDISDLNRSFLNAMVWAEEVIRSIE